MWKSTGFLFYIDFYYTFIQTIKANWIGFKEAKYDELAIV